MTAVPLMRTGCSIATLFLYYSDINKWFTIPFFGNTQNPHHLNELNNKFLTNENNENGIKQNKQKNKTASFWQLFETDWALNSEHWTDAQNKLETNFLEVEYSIGWPWFLFAMCVSKCEWMSSLSLRSDIQVQDVCIQLWTWNIEHRTLYAVQCV